MIEAEQSNYVLAGLLFVAENKVQSLHIHGASKAFPRRFKLLGEGCAFAHETEEFGIAFELPGERLVSARDLETGALKHGLEFVVRIGLCMERVDPGAAFPFEDPVALAGDRRLGVPLALVESEIGPVRKQPRRPRRARAAAGRRRHRRCARRSARAVRRRRLRHPRAR